MKKSSLLLLMMLGFLSFSFTLQEPIWLDQNLNETTQEKAVYYKVVKKLEGEVSYFYKSKSLFRKVFYVDRKLEGIFSEYYNTGELREVGKYKNGLREGNWKEYYKTGKIFKRGRYHKGDKVGIWKVFYKND
ncbi:toxin-antitoxin system YwqK family antitoxin [Polaribacter sp. R77954]|uniref:toxin-antitoxin system YwqK family antitoxin n=1 Tax=Polaribacter sp. R77954 TaxID=3093870 RepID=UPI0037C624ED